MGIHCKSLVMNEIAVAGLTPLQSVSKRTFDVIVASAGLVSLWWLIAIAYIAAAIDRRGSGFFLQKRVGCQGKLFSVIKITTMRDSESDSSTVTSADDSRITPLGRILRRTKVDELPQLWNVLRGDMSFVGPRPDVPGFADCLEGIDRTVLTVRPGITGPATLKYRDEEAILATKADPEGFNRDVIFPDKVRINIRYVQNWSFCGDVQYLWQTLLGLGGDQ